MRFECSEFGRTARRKIQSEVTYRLPNGPNRNSRVAATVSDRVLARDRRLRCFTVLRSNHKTAHAVNSVVVEFETDKDPGRLSAPMNDDVVVENSRGFIATRRPKYEWTDPPSRKLDIAHRA